MLGRQKWGEKLIRIFFHWLNFLPFGSPIEAQSGDPAPFVEPLYNLNLSRKSIHLGLILFSPILTLLLCSSQWQHQTYWIPNPQLRTPNRGSRFPQSPQCSPPGWRATLPLMWWNGRRCPRSSWWWSSTWSLEPLCSKPWSSLMRAHRGPPLWSRNRPSSLSMPVSILQSWMSSFR